MWRKRGNLDEEGPEEHQQYKQHEHLVIYIESSGNGKRSGYDWFGFAPWRDFDWRPPDRSAGQRAGLRQGAPLFASAGGCPKDQHREAHGSQGEYTEQGSVAMLNARLVLSAVLPDVQMWLIRVKCAEIVEEVQVEHIESSVRVE